jgi:uncharacterized membrane protein YhaH (DUF805 family)
MLTKIHLSSILLITLLFWYPCYTFAVEIKIGEDTLQIPDPIGFTDVSSASKDQLAIFEDFLPKTNRLIAAFVTEQDAGHLMLGESADLRQYFMVQSLREFGEMTLSKAQFAEIRTLLRKEYKTIFLKQKEAMNEVTTRAGKSLSKRFGENIEFNVNGIAPLGVDDESASHIAISLLSKYRISIDKEVVDYVVAVSMVALLVKGKVLYLNAYRTYQDDKDIEWTRVQISEWWPKIVSANEKTWLLADGRIVPQGTVIDSHIQDLISGEQTEYRSKGHAKAEGLDIGLKYPAAWHAEEADRPHIVQKFNGSVSSSGITPMCMVAVQDLPAGFSFLIDDDSEAALYSDGFKDMIPSGAVFIDGGKTQLDSESGAWMKYYWEQESAGMHIGMYCLQYFLFYEGKVVDVQCMVAGPAENKVLVEDAFTTYLPVFQLIGNNIILYDKWNKPLFSKFWWAILIVLAGLAWVIGFIPPFFPRSIFRRQELPKSTLIDNLDRVREQQENPDNQSIIVQDFSEKDSEVFNKSGIAEPTGLKSEGENVNWYFEVLKKYGTFTGRARRKEYWYFFLFNFIIGILLIIVDTVTGSLKSEIGLGILSGLYSLVVLIPGIAVSVRRLHDTNLSGWWLLIALIPLIGGIVLLFFMVEDSKPGENRYGQNPKDSNGIAVSS